MKKLPILLLQSRPEDDVCDNEFEAVCSLGGVSPERVVRLRMERDELGDIALDDYAAIIMGGGPANFATSEDKKSAEQRRYEAWLIGFMQHIIAADKPFLGMCLGIGTVVMALGMRPSYEYGEPVTAVEVVLDAAAIDDPLLEGLPPQFYALVGHKEGIGEVPADSVELARSATCVQLLRCGRHVYASQFHPELDLASLALRVKAYKDHGYFSPEEGDAIVASAAQADTHHAVKVLQNFVHQYAS